VLRREDGHLYAVFRGYHKWVIVTREAPGWSTLLGIGSVSAAAVAAGIVLGWWLDGVFSTSPILVVIGIALGIVGGVCYTAVLFRHYLKN
jgi:hypothetical protein